MSSAIPPAHRHEDHHDHDDIVYPQVIPFLLVHAACFVAIWTGVTWEAVIIGIALYWLRMFGITAGYHRYFSHRSYATSRVFQFILACLAQSTAQKSVLWWAAKHRHHHLFSDTEHDVHSPRHTGFLFAHVGWIFARKHDAVDLVKVGDLTKYPELMWLHKYELAPADRSRPDYLPDRRLAGSRRRLLLEHGGGLSRHLLHQLARPRAWLEALCDG